MKNPGNSCFHMLLIRHWFSNVPLIVGAVNYKVENIAEKEIMLASSIFFFPCNVLKACFFRVVKTQVYVFRSARKINCMTVSADPSEIMPGKKRSEDIDTMVMDTKLKIIEILKVIF